MTQQPTLCNPIDYVKHAKIIPTNFTEELRILDKVTALEQQESQLLPKISDVERQNFYREALKYTGDVKVICPKCKQSPWEFKKGKNKCQVCGNKLTETNT